MWDLDILKNHYYDYITIIVKRISKRIINRKKIRIYAGHKTYSSFIIVPEISRNREE